jgi:hypothetical protein
MADTPDLDLNQTIEQKKARLAQQAAAIDLERAAIDRKIAELDEIQRLTELAAKHNLVVSAVAAGPKDGEKVNTLIDLIDRYRTDPRSNYQKLRYNVRRNYDNLLKRIIEEPALGPEHIADLDAAKIMAVYERWSAGGKLALGHSLFARLRLLSSFGVTVLNDDACVRFSSVLHRMRIRRPQGGAETLTAAHVKAIRAKAHEMKRPSMALAQAFQFDLRLKQTDVIGEWVPLSEPGVSDIISDTKGKWIRGLRWEEIDSNLILRHVTSMWQEEVVINLRNAPMVMEELSKLGKLPSRGPVIACEGAGGEPWIQSEYRRWWRKLADAAGVPKTVKNMNSSLVEGSNENRSLAAPVSL